MEIESTDVWVVDPLESPDIDQFVVFTNDTVPDFFLYSSFSR